MFLFLMILVFVSCEEVTCSFSTPNHISYSSSSSSILSDPSSPTSIISDPSTPPYPSSPTSIPSDPSSGITMSPYPSCFRKGTTWSSQESSDIITGVEDVYSCQALCLNSNTCHHFTWFNEQAAPFDLDCFLYDGPTVEYSCSNCVSGPQSCTCSGHFSCQFTPDNFVGDVPHVETEIMCQDFCIKTDQCTFYSWFETDPFPKLCLMFSSCEEKDLNCMSCHSGPSDCENTAIMTSTSTPTTTTPPSTTTSTPTTTTQFMTTTTLHPYTSCFSQSVTFPHTDMIGPPHPATDAYSCQHQCANSSSCTDFTFYPHNKDCLLFERPTNIVDDNYNCWSGPKFCTCSYPGSCVNDGDNLVDIVRDVLEEDWCRQLCFQNVLCSAYTWFDETTPISKYFCFMFSNCQELDLSCQGCFTGLPSISPDCFDCPHQPAPQKHGDWFCPPSIPFLTCHLECHPGYISSNSTVILCEGGVWTEEPSCVPAVALITGGYSSKNTVEVYAEGLHQKMPDLPDNRDSHSLQLVNSVVLLCGGQYTKTSCLTFTASHEWESHSTTVNGRLHHASISMMGQLYLLGGSSSGSTTENLKPPFHQWNDGWLLIESNYGACAAKMEPEVFMLTGGSAGSHKSAVSYNVTSGTAARLQDLINPYYFHGCAAVRDAETGFRGIVVAGGYHGSTGKSEMYDIKTGEWSVTGKLTTARDDVRLVVLGQNILALGGDGLTSVDKFNLTTRTWSPTEEMMEIRNYHAVTGVPPSLVGIRQN